MLILGALLVLGFLATSLASYFVSKGEIHAAIVDRELPLTSDTVYSEIQKDLVRPIFISSMMASDTFLRDWVLAGENEVSRITKYLEEVQRRYGAFTSFFVSESTRLYYHSSGVKPPMRADNPDNAWYFRVRQMEEPYEINVDPDQVNRNTLTIFINYRVLDYQGRYLGVTGVGLTVDAVRHLLSDYQKRYQRSVYFVDAKGKVVLFGERPSHGADDIAKVPSLRDIAPQILASRLGSYQYRFDGRNHLLNVRYVPELKWFLFVEKVEDDAMAGIRETLYINLAICAGVSLLILLLTGVTLNRYQGRLEEMATIDKLSGLLNRQAFEVLFLQTLAELRRSPAPLAAVLLDIDHFKQINDRFGHLCGDQVIEQVAATMKSRLRESDIPCRWGGEEFLVLLKNCDRAQAAALAEALRSAVADLRFEFDGQVATVTVSAGIAAYRDGDSPERLVDRADQRLYAAKRGGRDRVVAEELSADPGLT
ncbi:MAG TPA: sensor domain-containing diguanylate cyclase [Rhodocyclaceae bacterium]